MELDTIKQYSHKIKKIYVKNDNSISQYNNVVIKIHIDDKKDNEIIRFSMGEYDSWLTHQSLDNDYFLEIPNKMKTTITIYAHYFPVSLYDYLEDQQIFSIYNWDNILDTQINSTQYDHTIDDNGNLIVRSLLNNSIDRFKNPNYKNYTNLNIDNTVSNSTEKGYFPLSSRYRGYRYLEAPSINDNVPYWGVSAPSPLTDCTRSTNPPYWEAKIHRSNLSPLIGDTQDDEYLPINVHFNYQYLPSSTEYHQHYFGFEPENIQPMTTDYYKTFTVLDSENLTTINEGFGEESTYRIINQGNPFDDSHILTIPHDKIIPIGLESGIIEKDSNNNNTCKWEKSLCDEYWTYTPNGKGSVSINLDLNEDEMYKLQYFIYIPTQSIVENDSCFVYIEHRDDFNNLSITNFGESVQDILLNKDKELRDQWIYHEVDFKAQKSNRIVIKGPQHESNHDKIFFTNFKLIQIDEYSPTLKYTENGLYVTEEDKYTIKSISEQDSNCALTNRSKITSWNKKNTLPTPIIDVILVLEDDFDISYDENTFDLSWTRSLKDDNFDIKHEDIDEVCILKCQNTNNIKMEYDGESYDLKVSKVTKKKFTIGNNNSFSLRLQDPQKAPITSGEVECAITDTKDNISCDESIICLGKAYPDDDGRITFKNIDFRNLQYNKTYYLKIVYTNNCYNKTITKFKELAFEQEHINMDAYINCQINQNIGFVNLSLVRYNLQHSMPMEYMLKHMYENICFVKSYNRENNEYDIYQTDNRIIKTIDDLPIHISTKIYNQLNNNITKGYCELSIDDRIVQSTLVNNKGIADFYIDYEDMYETSKYDNYNDIFTQNIKIEYFNENGEFVDYIYFDVIYDIDEGYDSRPAVPIKIYSMSSNEFAPLTSPIYNINKDEIFILNIDTEDNKDFYIKVMCNNNIIMEKNVYDIIDDMFIIFCQYNNSNIDEYTIFTSSIEQNGPYRKNQRKFTVKWK